jgi:hypothetical protein
MLTETAHGPDFLRSEANGTRSRRNIVIDESQTLLPGRILGTKTRGAVTSAAKSGGNTGNGALTLDPTTPKLANSQLGVYLVRNVGDTFDAAIAAAGGNTGNGVASLGTPKFLTGAQVGVYKVIALEPATDLGTFEVFDPAGVALGKYVVGGAAFGTQVKFTIADGSTDFVAGDTFNITVTKVTATDTGLFQVTAPDGTVIGTYATGAAAFATQIKFTIADGGTDFIVGDGFDITIAAGTGRLVAHSPSAVDGSEVASDILYLGVTTGVGETANAVGVYQDVEIVADRLAWGAHDTNQKAAALAELALQGVVAI